MVVVATERSGMNRLPPAWHTVGQIWLEEFTAVMLPYTDRPVDSVPDMVRKQCCLDAMRNAEARIERMVGNIRSTFASEPNR